MPASGEHRGEHAVAAPQVEGVACPVGLGPVALGGEQQAGTAVEAGAVEHPAVGHELQAGGLLLGGAWGRDLGRACAPGVQGPALADAPLGLHLLEGAPEHVVLPRGHVLGAPGGHEHHARGGVGGHGAGDVLQGVQRGGQVQQDELGSLHGLGEGVGGGSGVEAVAVGVHGGPDLAGGDVEAGIGVHHGNACSVRGEGGAVGQQEARHGIEAGG